MPFMSLRLCAAALSVAALAGCSTVSSWTPDLFKSKQSTFAAESSSGVTRIQQDRFLGIFSPYRVDIQQGNFISREMVAQLKEAMQSKDGVTREQVRFLLGTPLVDDVFHENRWDYVFRLQKSDGEVILSRVSVFFDDGKLKKLDGGDLPTEKDYLSLIAGNEPAPPPPQETNGLDSPKKPRKE